MRSKIIFIISLPLILSSALLFNACKGDSDFLENSFLSDIFDSSSEKEDRFRFMFFEEGIAIIIDTDTSVQYLWCEDYRKAGLTVLLDVDGKPLLYKDAENESETEYIILSQ